jgi:hypothetical protein
VVLTDVRSVQVVLKQGDSVPHDSNIKRLGNKILVRQGGGTALTAPTVSDGGAAEFDAAVSGTGPWDVAVTWVAAGLSVLARGVYSRTLTITSTSAVNSPLAIPVRIEVL